MPDCWGIDKIHEIDQALTKSSSEVPQPDLHTSFLQHLLSMPIPTSVEEQLNVLCSIPNYNFWDWMKIADKPGVQGAETKCDNHPTLVFCP
jgi:hypothetical protein